MRLKILPPVLLLMSPALWAQSETELLESRLSAAQGADRLELLAELTTAYHMDDATRAVASGTEALELLHSYPDETRELSVLNHLVYALVSLGDYPQALQLGARAEHLAHVEKDSASLAFALRNRGRVYRSRGETRQAFEVFRRSAKLCEEAGEPRGLGDSWTDISITHWLMGDYPAALDGFIRAHQIYEEIGEPRELAGALNNIGIVHKRLGDAGKALELYLEALEMRRQIGPPGSVANVLNNIGNVYRDLGKPEQALEYFLEALEIGPADASGHANTLVNTGSCYQALGDLDLAVEFYQRALVLNEQTENRKGSASALLSIAGVERRRGRDSVALATLRKSLAIALEVDAKTEIQQAYLGLSELYALAGRYQEAYESSRSFEKIKSEIFNAENSKNIVDMQARFESDRQARQIEILKQQQTIDALEISSQHTGRRVLIGGLFSLLLVLLVLYNRYRLKVRSTRLIEHQKSELEQTLAELRASEADRRRLEEETVRQQERERYITELEASKAEVEAQNAELERFTYTVSHDLKSPLVTIRGFVGLLKKDVSAGDVARIETDLERIGAAAAKMGQLLEELLELARIGRLVNPPESVSMGDLTREAIEILAVQISERGAQIEVESEMPVLFVDRSRFVEVMQNLIENAVKFMGEQAEPRVTIGSRHEEGQITCYVRDNGSGVDPRYREKIFGLFDRLNLDVDGTGVGLAVVRRIIELHGGRVWVESEGIGKGSVFLFTLPESPPSVEDTEGGLHALDENVQ